MTIIQINNAIQINQARLDRLYAKQRELGIYDYEKFSERLIEVINDYFKDDITIQRRHKNKVRGRQMYYAIMKSQTPFTLSLMASKIGHQDHATVISALNKFNDLFDVEKSYRRDYEKIISKINFVN